MKLNWRIQHKTLSIINIINNFDFDFKILKEEKEENMQVGLPILIARERQLEKFYKSKLTNIPLWSHRGIEEIYTRVDYSD